MVGRHRRIGSVVVVAGVLGLAAIAPATESSAVSGAPGRGADCHGRMLAPPCTRPSRRDPAGTWLIGITRAGRLAAYTPGSKHCDAYCGLHARTISVTGSRLTIGKVPICPTKGTYSWKSGVRLADAASDSGCGLPAAPSCSSPASGSASSGRVPVSGSPRAGRTPQRCRGPG